MVKQNKKEGREKKDGRDKNSRNPRDYDTRFPPQTLVLAKNKHDEWHEATVIEIQPLTSEENKRSEEFLKYYVHYTEFNRRWDEWVPFEKIRPWEQLSGSMPTNEDNIIKHDEHEGFDEKNLAKHEESTRIKTISYIAIGKHKCETWYFSPFPEYFQDIDTLYVCEFCLSFYRHESEIKRHAGRCQLYHPLGNEIYREGEVSMFEIDGARNVLYCENLCYISKLFLDHKNLSYDVEPFMFYVLTEVDEFGCHLAGYFSKEKDPTQGNNLSCILVMPYIQRKGFGKFLISFSYELSRREQRIGTPERPLSDLGYASYFSWWSAQIIDVLEKRQGENLSIADISQITYIKPMDVLEVLEKLNILRYSGGTHELYSNQEYLNELKKTTGKPGRAVYPEKLHWTPIRAFDSK